MGEYNCWESESLFVEFIDPDVPKSTEKSINMNYCALSVESNIIDDFVLGELSGRKELSPENGITQESALCNETTMTYSKIINNIIPKCLCDYL